MPYSAAFPNSMILSPPPAAPVASGKSSFRFRVAVTQEIPQPGLEVLRDAGCRVDFLSGNEPCPRAVLVEAVKSSDALVCFPSDRVDRTLLAEAAGRVKIVAAYGVGVNHIDLAAAKSCGIRVANTPDVLTDATAEHALALLLAAARHVAEADRFVRSGSWHQPSATLFLGREIAGSTVGVVGAGKIGQSFLAKASALGAKAIYTATRRNPDLEQKTGARFAPLHELLAASDFISLHVPLTAETEGLLDDGAFAVIKPGAILVNTARGRVVDEAALIAALRSGRLGGAGLDVFPDEPAVSAELLALPGVICTPHIGSATLRARARMTRLVADNIFAVLVHGAEPLTSVA